MKRINCITLWDRTIKGKGAFKVISFWSFYFHPAASRILHLCPGTKPD